VYTRVWRFELQVKQLRQTIKFDWYILNNSGKIIAFGGRILGDGQPKYLNSPETSLFLKSKQLFGIFNAKKLLHKKSFIICEGYTDVICLHSYGYPAVASLGTALGDDQIETIFSVVDEAFLVFDGDIAGKNATDRVFHKYLPKLKLKKKLKFVFLWIFLQQHLASLVYQLFYNHQISQVPRPKNVVVSKEK